MLLALRGFDVSIKSLQVKCLWGVENSDLQLELNVHVLGYLKIALKPAAAEDVNGESDHDQGGSHLVVRMGHRVGRNEEDFI